MKRSISLKLQTYETVARAKSGTINPPPLRGFHAVRDYLFNFSVESYSRDIDTLIGNVSNFVGDTRVFIEKILIARKNRKSIRLFSRDLKETIDTFADYQKTIQKMLWDVTKKTSRCNIVNVIVKNFEKGLIFLILLLVVICAGQLSISTTFHRNVTYTIPAYIIDRVLVLNSSLLPAPNRTTMVTTRAATIRSTNIYTYTYPESKETMSTQVNQTTKCNTTSDFSCTEVMDSVASLKTLFFYFSLLWSVVFFVHLKMTWSINSFLELRNKIACLYEKYVSFKYLIRFIEALHTDRQARKDGEFFWYDAEDLYQPQYNAIIDKYLKSMS